MLLLLLLLLFLVLQIIGCKKWKRYRGQISLFIDQIQYLFMLRNLLREKKIFIKVYLIIIFRRSYIILLSRELRNFEGALNISLKSPKFPKSNSHQSQLILQIPGNTEHYCGKLNHSSTIQEPRSRLPPFPPLSIYIIRVSREKNGEFSRKDRT